MNSVFYALRGRRAHTAVAWALGLVLAACGSSDGAGDVITANGGVDGGSTGGGGTGGQNGQSSGAASGGGTGSDGAVATDAGTISRPSEPVYLDACASGAAGLSDDEIATLKAATNSGNSRLLYPYDGTVFPRGLEGPLLMWDGVTAAKAVYVHIKSKSFEYEGCLAPTAEGQLQLPQDVWDTACAKTFGKGDPYAVSLSWLANGQAVGPVQQTWTLAQATIKGSVYYNSYTSLQLGAPGGKVFRIPPGGQAKPFVALECNGCHSVSANGARMTTQTLGTGGRIYNLEAGDAQLLTPNINAPYAALYPDGSRFVSNSLVIDVARSLATAFFSALSPAALYDTDTANEIPSKGIPEGALMPSFSPDGKYLVFNDFAQNNAHGLGMVQFDADTNEASGYKILFQDENLRPGWPFMLPDDEAVVFVRTDGANFSADGAGLVGGALFAPYSELFITDVSSGETTILARAMGYASAADAEAGKAQLPFGKEDILHAYFPTVSPVAAGGYFWVFFDALRHYGNRGLQRQLWGTAIEIAPDGDYAVDRSSPAFYLPGQEFGTGNHRAFTALDACKEDGESCESGVDCCGGFCTPPDGADELGTAMGTCASSAQQCARTDEHCELDTDCCPAEAGQGQNRCIAGFCAPVVIL